MSNENNTDNNTTVRRKTKPIVGIPSTEAQERHRDKAFTSGKRRNQGVIDLRSTGDNNRMSVVRDQHARRKLLESESNRGLQKDTIIWDDKKPIKAKDIPHNEVEMQRRTNRRPGDTPVTQT